MSWESSVKNLLETPSAHALPHSAADEWRTHWTLVLAAMAGVSFYSVGSFTTGLFMEPLTREFGWTRAQVSAGLVITSLMTIPLSPLIGAVIDKWGSRALAIPGLLIAMATLAAFSLSTGSIPQWLILWAAFGVGSLLIKTTVWTAAISRTFDKSRGLALGVALGGTAITQMIAPYVTQQLIEHLGWRAAYVWLAVGWGGPVLLIVLLLFRATVASATSGAELRDEVADRTNLLPGLTFREALRSLPLIRIALSTLFIMFATVGILIHQVPMLREAGVPAERAALVAGLGGFAAILGKLMTGWLSDRFNGGAVGALTLGSTAVAYVILVVTRSELMIVLAMFIIGYASGTTLQVCAYLTSRYGGIRSFGKIFGVMTSMIAVGGGIGPLTAGAVYDRYGTYGPMLELCAVLCVAAGLLIFRLGPPSPSSEKRGVSAF